MKIAIESNDGVNINSPFTRTNGYLVYEIGENGIKDSEFIKTSQEMRNKNTVSPKKDPTVLKDCKAVISRGMDQNRFLDLKNKGIDVFITFKSSAKDAVKVFMKESILKQSIF